jgi:hypothetical protein
LRRWTNQRLTRLFGRYNRLYWSGKLPQYFLRLDEPNEEYVGWCDWQKRTIWIVVEGQTDRDIRSTLLHEMCHAATAPKTEHHGYRFWGHVEALLRKRAPITIANSEAPTVRFFGRSIPARFPLSRNVMERLERRRVLQVLRMGKAKGLREHVITDGNIVAQFGNEEVGMYPWAQALRLVGYEFGLLDVGGKPKDRWAAKIIAQGRRVHTTARRDYLFELRLKSDENFRARCIAKLLKAPVNCVE